jgi:hypothetical protein
MNLKMILLVSTCSAAIAIGLNNSIELKPDRIFFSSCNYVWKHKTNNPVLMRNAFSQGANGVEIDVMYDDLSEKFFVSRNRPYDLYLGELIDIEHMFSIVQKNQYVWVDLKDADKIIDSRKAATELKRIIDKYNLTKQVIVESTYAWPLKKLRDLGVYTSYWTSFNRKQVGNFRYFFKDNLRKIKLRLGRFDVMSMPYYHYTNDFKEGYKNFPSYIFTVNELSDLKEYAKDSQVKVVLSDLDDIAHANQYKCGS